MKSSPIVAKTTIMGEKINIEYFVPIKYKFLFDSWSPRDFFALIKGIRTAITVQGVDGEWVNIKRLKIPSDNFLKHDLTRPLDLERSFDLAISLEVAEHLDEKYAAGFVETLCKHAPVVFFSAAIPYQAGTNHVNLQWQDYWSNLFDEFNYVPIDYIRNIIWNNPEVEWWYSQNSLLYVKKDFLEHQPALKQLYEQTRLNQLSVVHPTRYLIEVNALRGEPFGGVRSSLQPRSWKSTWRTTKNVFK